MTIHEAINWANKILKESGVSEPDSSALVLLGDVLGMTRAEILAHPEKMLTSIQLNWFRRYVGRRRKHESVWHIIGEVEFMGLPFIVNKNVLVPRPETELLVEQVIQQLKPQTSNLKPVSILDVGTGSGAIAISLARFLKTSKLSPQTFNLVATDISASALKIAKQNAKINKVADKIMFLRTDLFPKTSSLSPQTFNLITANLPYIPSEDMKSLAVDVHHYEPKIALDGGKGGLEIYEKFLAQVGDYLRLDGIIFCEIGINQSDAFKKIAKKYFPKAKVDILGDLAGIDRVAIITLSNN